MNVALHPQHLDIISICTGGGGLDLGIELAIPGARTVCMVEREAFAVAHLVAAMQQGLLAECPVWSDARTFDGRAWRGCVDGLIGGIPCQPHSHAGKRQGSDDERDLWSDARRIVVQSRPWFVLIENVSGMLSAKPGLDPGAFRVWRDLQRLGFDVEGGLFTAAEIGASHERERVFILGVAHGNREHGDRRRVRWTRGRGQSSNGSDEVPGVGLADAFSAGLEGCERRTARSWDKGSASQRDSQGVAGVDQVDASGDGWRERGAEPEVRSGRHPLGGSDDAMGDPIGGGHDRGPDDTFGRSVGRTSSEGAVGTPFLFPPGPDHLPRWASVLASSPEFEPAFRRVADGLASRLDIARVDRLRMLGNGVVPLQAAYAVRTLATRLAERGSAGAARLVRMMEVA